MNHTITEQPSRKTQHSDAAQIPVWLYGAAFFFCSLLATGCGVFMENHAFHVALVHLFNNVALYPHDPYASALARYASLLWPVVAWAAKLVPLEPLLLGAFLAERLLLLYAVARLARAFAPRSTLAPIAAMAAFASGVTPLLGDGTIMRPYFEQTGFALVFLILAAAALIESRPVFFAIWLAVGFNLQSMYGIFALTYFGAVLVTSETHRRDWKKWAATSVLFLCLATPAIFFGLEAVRHGGGDNALWLKISHVRSPWHLYPLTWSMQSFLRFGASMLLLIMLLGDRKNSEGRLFNAGLAWSGVALFWLFEAFMAAYVVKSPTLLVFQSARATDVWLCLAAVLIATTLAIRIEENATGHRPWKAAVIALFVTLLFWRPLDSLLLYALAACVLAFAAETFCTSLFLGGNPGRLAACLAAAVFVIALHDAGVRTTHIGIKRALLHQPSLDVKTSAAWALANTSADAVFLVDPGSEDWEIFRGLSQRSVFTTFVEGGAINWDRGFVAEWVERLRALGVDLTRPGGFKDVEKALSERYANLRDEDVTRLRARYEIDYWIVPEQHDSSFPVVFKTGGYKVLKTGS